MALSDYRLVAQVATGPDAVAYRAEIADGRAVRLLLLSSARGDVHRWDEVQRRLRRTACVAHPGIVPIAELNLEADSPYVAFPWIEGHDLSTEFAGQLPLPATDAWALIKGWAAILDAAHRMGMAHGRLHPGTILRTAEGQWTIDITRTDPPALGGVHDCGEVADACRAPEATGKTPTAAEDVYALGAIFSWLISGRVPRRSDSDLTASIPSALDGSPRPSLRIVEAMRAEDPMERPVLDEIRTAPDLRPGATDLNATLPVADVEPANSDVSPTNIEPAERQELGRYRLLRKLGEGGMGTVYQGVDQADGRVVAVKVIRESLADRPSLLRRLHKEARLLAEVNNPYVANLLEINEDDGVHYLVLEYVEGQSLSVLLRDRRQLPEVDALAIIADVARALEGAHARGIVHRDVKPENILVGPGTPPVIKLSDFGLARHVIETESLQVTRDGAVLGTPLYMSPEQARGETVDPRADVYSLGATLFHLVAGRPPFLADSPLAVIDKHIREPAPPLRKFAPDAGEAVAMLVARTLAKHPAERFADAAELLAELDRMLRGEPITPAAHPRLPAGKLKNTLAYDFHWDLESTPDQLWSHVSNTERLNRAIGLSAVQFRLEDPDPTSDALQPAARRFGRFRSKGMTIDWQEHPYEWVEGRRLGVLREYTQGPFRWLLSTVELAPRPGGGTSLDHRIRLEPRGLLGRTVAAIEVGNRTRRALDRVYRRIDAAVQGRLRGAGAADPFEESPGLSDTSRHRLDQMLDRICQQSVDPTVVESLGDYLATAPDPEVARIRPLALARELRQPGDPFVAACLHGAREGLLVLLWDILCPVCRIPSEIKDSLRALREHGHCPACRFDFALDFATNVEMIFRAHPQVRNVELATYCIGGPVHSPHVVAQVRLAAGERLDLTLALGPGSYEIRSPQLTPRFPFRVEADVLRRRADVELARTPEPFVVGAGGQVLALVNPFDREVVIRVERTAPRDDALTAARAASLALFRELFPDEVLAPDLLIGVTTVTLLVAELDWGTTRLEELGDQRAFALFSEFYGRVADCARREGGSLVKTQDEAVRASFPDPAAAVRAAIALAASPGPPLRLGVHQGPALAATLHEHLDYFGATVLQAARLPRLARPGEILLTQPVAADVGVAAALGGRTLEAFRADLPAKPDAVLVRIELAPSA